MKCVEVTVPVMLRALRRQWKWLCGYTLVFAAAGVLAGFLWAGNLAAAPQTGGAVEGLPAPEAFAEMRNGEEYLAYWNHLSECSARWRSCLTLQSESSLNTAQQETLRELEEQWLEAEETLLLPLRERCFELARLPAEKQLTTRDADVEKQLCELAEELERLSAALQDAVREIAESNQLDITVFYDPALDENRVWPETDAPIRQLDTFTGYTRGISVLHGNGARSRQESFWIVTLFSTLTGICTGGYFAICRECGKEQKKIRQR